MSIPAEIKDFLRYEPLTGLFYWTADSGKMRYAGTLAGTLSHGYVSIQFKGKLWRAHRLAFYFMGCTVPPVVDHINGVRSDNRWLNLRGISVAENNLNRRCITDYPLGVAPCNRAGLRKKWQAYIDLHGKRKHLGYFHELQDAIDARKKAETEYGFHANHGQRQKTNTHEVCKIRQTAIAQHAQAGV